MSEIEVSYSKLPKIRFHRTKKWFLVTFGIEQKGPMGQHMPEKGALLSQFQSFWRNFLVIEPVESVSVWQWTEEEVYHTESTSFVCG